jgi:hypothetical protein
LVIHYYDVNRLWTNDAPLNLPTSEIKKHWQEQIISKVMAIIMFFVYVALMFIPAWISEKRLKLNIANSNIKNTI